LSKKSKYNLLGEEDFAMGRCGSVTGKLIIVLCVTVALAGIICLPAWAQVPANVRVGLITSNTGSQYRNASAVAFSVKGSYEVVDLATIPGGEVIAAPAESEEWQVFYLAGGLQICKNLEPVKTTTGPIFIRETAHSPANRVCLDDYTTNGSVANIGRWYRGNMEFRGNVNGVVVVNELPINEYLYGVVPREMSNSWPLEALKAQAIAARTYTVANYSKHVVEGFNMLDTTSDQVYGGFNSEGANATAAVQQTSGKILLYDGQPISAVYHSTSGGHTEDNDNVWSSTPCAYLRGKDDPYSTKRGLANWTYTTSIDDVKNKLIQAGQQIGPISSIKLDKYHSGRVETVIVSDINGNTITKSGTAFGQMFNPGFKTDSNGGSNNIRFMSRFFDVKMDQVSNPVFSVLNGAGQKASAAGASLYGISDDGDAGILNPGGSDFYAVDASGASILNKAAAGTVVFPGHGWGHGVGMSQWGAYEMADQGKSYEDILTFYYTGVEISS